MPSFDIIGTFIGTLLVIVVVFALSAILAIISPD